MTHLYASAGIGMITIGSRGRKIPHDGDGWQWTEYETVTKTALNFPIQLGVDFGGRYVSAGLAFVGNLNTIKSNGGVLFTLNLGKLRAGT